MTDRRLLVVHHSPSPSMRALTDAVVAGAGDDLIEGVEVVVRPALEASAADVLGADGILLGTPANFGYMSGALKDFFDRTYYPCEGKLVGLPYAVFVSAGNDGTGAVREIGRIANGYGWKMVAEALIVRREITPADLERARELGEAMAAGLAMGVF